MRPILPVDKQKLVKSLYNQGLNYRQISEASGVNLQTAYKHITNHVNIKKKKSLTLKETEERIIKFRSININQKLYAKVINYKKRSAITSYFLGTVVYKDKEKIHIKDTTGVIREVTINKFVAREVLLKRCIP